MTLRNRLRLALSTAALATAIMLPSTAQAGVLVADAANCDSQTFSQPFLPWADPASYTLQPGGDFEADSPTWNLSAGAAGVAGNEPYEVTDEYDGRSLALNAGSTATSPAICVGIEHPDIRFFARGSNSFASLKVEVLFNDANGATQTLQIGTVTGNNAWSPTVQMPIVANLLALLPGSKTPVAFRLSATTGNWKVDDFYVDPYARW